jgi:hypothetical protein
MEVEGKLVVEDAFLTGAATAIAQYIAPAVVSGSNSFRSFRLPPVLHYILVSLVHQSYSVPKRTLWYDRLLRA